MCPDHINEGKSESKSKDTTDAGKNPEDAERDQRLIDFKAKVESAHKDPKPDVDLGRLSIDINKDAPSLLNSKFSRSLSTRIAADLDPLAADRSGIKGMLPDARGAASNREFHGGLAANDLTKFGAGAKFFFGKPFQQMRKADFQLETKDFEAKKLLLSVDDFLKQTMPGDDTKLSHAEKQEMVKSRQAISSAANMQELLDGMLYLAKLYEHLQYIDEAKKAAQLALSIDPDNVAGKQLFDEMERIHPVDVGAAVQQQFEAEPLLTKSQLRKRIANLSSGRVIVLGDLLIDELMEGKPERISREAPVLILEHLDTQWIPGGAANTAHNIASLGGTCHAIGVCGADEYAGKLAELLQEHGISYDLVEDRSRPTTVKTRILSKRHHLMHQLLRLDRISHEPISPQIIAGLVQKLQIAASNFQAIVLSDYRSGAIADGVISACREIAKQHQVKLIADAQENFRRFHGFMLITPNQPDAEKEVGYEIKTRDDLTRAGHQILRSSDLEALLVTRGASGMALFQHDHHMLELPAFNRSDVFDVTGAGDTVVATMALALVTGSTFFEAMALGNLAAGIVVKKSGTAVTTQMELLETLEQLSIPED